MYFEVLLDILGTMDIANTENKLLCTKYFSLGRHQYCPTKTASRKVGAFHFQIPLPSFAQQPSTNKVNFEISIHFLKCNFLASTPQILFHVPCDMWKILQTTNIKHQNSTCRCSQTSPSYSKAKISFSGNYQTRPKFIYLKKCHFMISWIQSKACDISRQVCNIIICDLKFFLKKYI